MNCAFINGIDYSKSVTICDSVGGKFPSNPKTMNSRKRPHLPLRCLIVAQLTLIICDPLARAQTAPAAAAAPAAASTESKDVTVLSPFEVVAEQNGYYSGNTMSGTRFNTKLADLASSITVMSKEQMSDFGMLDVNDIFLYVAGTEGTGTYTDFTLDRNGSASDNVQLNPTQANRVRGIAPANTSLGNIETMGRVPIDPISVDAIEISRGPNANVFGLGNPSGTVNQVPASANLARNRLTTSFRADSYDGYRTSLDVNQTLIKGKLAIRASGVFQHDAFQRKPSGVDTERYNGMVKFQPFKYTTITGAVNYYHAYGNRPNALPPRDDISYWIANGSPTWDPTTQQIHNQDGTLRLQVNATASNLPDYFSNNYLGNDRNQMFIDPTGGLVYWSAPRSTSSTTSPVGATLGGSRFLQPNPVAGAFSGTAGRSLAQYLFNTSPTIADKNIYDYTSINISSPNRFDDRTTTSTITLDQMIINTAAQTLAAQATFMREDSLRWSRNLIGIANDNGTSGSLTVDINEKLLDGTPNPYFLHPYLSVDKPRTVSLPAVWDTARGQLAYRLDLTHSENKLLKYLGWFQLTGYGEAKNRVNRQYSYRDGIASPTVSWIPAGTYRGFQSVPTGTPALINLTQGLYRYYVGDKGLNVDVAPGDFKAGTYNFVWGTSPTYNSSGAVVTPAAMHSDSLLLDRVAADKTGGTLNTKLIIKTVGGVVQNHLLGDRLITTLGARYDQTFTTFGDPGTPTNNFLNADGITFNNALTDAWATKTYRNGGRTTNVQFVLRPFMDTSITASLERKGTSSSHFLASLLNGFSVNTNRSNSFLIVSPAQDLYRNVLPNPTGTDKSWGLGLNLFDGKLVARMTRFDNYQRNAQTSDVNTLAGRVLRLDFVAPVGAGNPTPFLNLYNNATRWVQFANPSWTADQVAAEVKNQTKFSTDDRDYYVGAGASTLPIGATSDIRSVGTELEINYNPTRFWTVTASVTDTKSIGLNTSKALVDWIAERTKVWEKIVDPSITTANAIAEGNPEKLWWKHRYSAVATIPGAASFSASAVTPQQNFAAFVKAPLGIIAQQEGKSNPQIRRYAFRAASSFQLAAITDNKWLKNVTVGGALRWEDKAAIGYYGVGYIPGLPLSQQPIFEMLDSTKPIYDKSHDYVDLFVTYKTKLWHDKVAATFQFNVKNLMYKTRLQPVGAFPDGTISTYRIADPQQFILSASFDM